MNLSYNLVISDLPKWPLAETAIQMLRGDANIIHFREKISPYTKMIKKADHAKPIVFLEPTSIATESQVPSVVDDGLNLSYVPTVKQVDPSRIAFAVSIALAENLDRATRAFVKKWRSA